MAVSGNRADRRRHAVSTADLTAALEHHRAGRLERAERLYRKFLQKAPGNPDALHLLGVLAVVQGNPDQAIQLIGRALAAVPDFAEGHSNLGNALRVAGRLAEACASYRRAIELRPDFAAAHCNLGVVLSEQGNFAAAVASFERSIGLDPRNAEAHAGLGNALCRMGRLEAAEPPLRQAVQLNPDSFDLQINLANVLLELRRFGAAAACYRRGIEIDPRQVRAHRGLATSLRAAGDISSAIARYRDALALSPSEAPLWNDLGRCFLALGRLDEAIEAFRRALALDADLADAYRNLAACRLLPTDDQEMARVAGLAERTDLPIEERATAGFAVAKALDDADRYDEAFVTYDSANRLYRAARAAAGDRFDAAALARQIDGLIADFTPAFFAAVSGWGNPSDLPVFIVGLPRSGTTLVEQIAASHSRVFGAGELREIGETAAELGAPWTQAAVRRAADAHLERLSALGGDADRIIDKLPDNIFMLGVIATLYPAARIIFCRRDPRDIGVSCYFQKFSAGSLTFSYDLADCGRRIRETERLAAHWHRVLPLRWLDIHYESLVADLEGESRRLIEFLGLAWEPSCLDFHRTLRAVQTASSWQVRQPLYHRSVGRWRHYERHLGPLLAELASSNTEDPAMPDKGHRAAEAAPERLSSGDPTLG
jgi:tetratricopeptide (TPR) repeat protein